MAFDFPADVVKTTDKFSTELRKFDGISPDDIARLWKAYTTQSAVVRDVVVSRLENLFWRIWGNATIQQRLTGSVLATLFMAIHEDASLQITNHSPQLKAITFTTNNKVTESQQNHNSSPKNERRNPLPPILKKTDGTRSVPPSEPSSHKTTRILVPERSSEGPGQKATRDTIDTEDGKGSKSTAVNSTSAAQKPVRRRPTFVANRAASSRRRGVLIRRKSSQTSPVTSPTVEETEDALQEQVQGGEEARQEEPAEEATAPSPAKENEISWRSMPYLMKFDEDTRNAPTEREVDPSDTSAPPTDFSVSSVRHHRSPEEHSQAARVENAPNGMVSDRSLVEQDFRTNFVQRQRQGSAFATRNNSAASSLTTQLSSTNFRELLNASEAAATMQRKDSGSAARSLSPGPRYILLPKHDGPVNLSSAMTSPTRKLDGRDRSRRPIIINTSASSKALQERRADDNAPGSNYPSAVAVSESVISTSQQTTNGVFSVPKESQELLGEQLTNLIKGKGKDNKTKLGQRVGS